MPASVRAPLSWRGAAPFAAPAPVRERLWVSASAPGRFPCPPASQRQVRANETELSQRLLAINLHFCFLGGFQYTPAAEPCRCSFLLYSRGCSRWVNCP